MATYTYQLSGDPKAAFTAALQALTTQRYAVNRHSEWSATAESGSTTKVAIFGGFSPHVRLSVSLATQGDGSALRLVSTTSGAAGGLLGLSKVRKAVQKAGDGVRDALDSAGQLGGIEVS